MFVSEREKSHVATVLSNSDEAGKAIKLTYVCVTWVCLSEWGEGK